MAKELICYYPVFLLGLTAVSLPPFNQANYFGFLEASAILGIPMPGASLMVMRLFFSLSVGTLLVAGISATPEQSPQDAR
jgi:hypothetical protein